MCCISFSLKFDFWGLVTGKRCVCVWLVRMDMVYGYMDSGKIPTHMFAGEKKEHHHLLSSRAKQCGFCVLRLFSDWCCKLWFDDMFMWTGGPESIILVSFPNNVDFQLIFYVRSCLYLEIETMRSTTLVSTNWDNWHGFLYIFLCVVYVKHRFKELSF